VGSSSTDATAGESVISLPSGGGAIGSSGETFSADQFTGTGNFSVPITLPAGRNGLAPQMTMGYSTGNGNGPFGLGWSASLPGVTRKTARGVPRYRDDGSVTRVFADSGLTSKPTDIIIITIIITAITLAGAWQTSYGRLSRRRYGHGKPLGLLMPNRWWWSSRYGLSSARGSQVRATMEMARGMQ